jgi:hypothetical protein
MLKYTATLLDRDYRYTMDVVATSEAEAYDMLDWHLPEGTMILSIKLA